MRWRRRFCSSSRQTMRRWSPCGGWQVRHVLCLLDDTLRVPMIKHIFTHPYTTYNPHTTTQGCTTPQHCRRRPRRRRCHSRHI